MAFFARKSRRNERPHDLQRQFDSGDTRRKTQHVAIIVFARLVR